MTIWNGITEQGAVVPIQVDAQGRVVVSGGGGAPSEVYGTAKVWGKVSSEGSVLFGSGWTGSKLSPGVLQITFTTPRTDGQYIVLMNCQYINPVIPNTDYNNASGFRIYTKNPNGQAVECVTDFAVFDALPAEVTPLILPTSTVNEVKALRSELEKLKKSK